MTELFIALALGVVEGLTEFIPVSSTGHLIVAGDLLGFEGDRANTFEVVIQMGAILAVALIYRRRLALLLRSEPNSGLRGRHGLLLLTITTMPALLVGGVFHDVITDHLFSPLTVALGWGLGGVVLLLVERSLPGTQKQTVDEITVRDALLIGLIQCLALWPGVSRAAATICGGMFLKFDRRTAAEYSFLAALPILTAAASAELFSSRSSLSLDDVPMFATGFGMAFFTAWLAVRFFLRLIASTTCRPFGWYRIAAAFALVSATGSGWL